MKKRSLLVLFVIPGLCGLLCIGGVILLLEMAGPSPITARIPSEESTGRRWAVIDADNIVQMEEFACLESGRAGPIAALAFTPDAAEILVVHGETGTLRRWRVDDGVLLSEFNIGPVGFAAVSFDGTASKLAGGAGMTPLTKGTSYAADFEGIRLWDTHSGKQLYQLVDIMVADLALSPNGERLVSVKLGILNTWNAVTGKSVERHVMADEIDGYRGAMPIYEVAFDPLGEWILYVTEQGSIILGEWDPKGEQRVDIHHANSPALPLASKIDPTRRWVALVRGNSLEVWRLRWLRLRPRLRIDLPDTPLADLDFSPDGSLLAVGAADGWQIWVMSRKRLASEVTGQPVYAVSFSPDGRLFSWGDADGCVHLWSVPTK